MMQDLIIPDSVLERLAKTGPGLELWWDSSPLVYENWQNKLVDTATADKRDLLAAQLKRLYDPLNPAASVFRGVTTNPPLSLNAMKDNPEYWQTWVHDYHLKHPYEDVEQVFWALYKEIVKRGAEAFMPIYQASGYKYGHLSGQLDPRVAFDYETMLAQALELSQLSPNVMIKVPGTKEGVQVIRELTSRGISTNSTLCFVVSQFVAVAEAVQDGLLEARRKGVNLSGWRSVVTQMSARWENAKEFDRDAEVNEVRLDESLKRLASIAIFKRAHLIFRWRAYPSKMLICSLRMGPVENQQQRVWHLELTAGADAVFTLPPDYIAQLITQADHLTFQPRIWEEIPETAQVLLRRVPYFRRGFDEDGYTLEEFNTLPPLVSTYNQFSAATEKMVDFVRQALPVGAQAA